MTTIRCIMVVLAVMLFSLPAGALDHSQPSVYASSYAKSYGGTGERTTLDKTTDRMPDTSEREKIRALCHNITPHDAQLLLNLIYWSWYRSHVTLTMQHWGEKNLHNEWNSWKSCIGRRLNPKAAPAQNYTRTIHDGFERAHEEFHAVQSAYARIIEIGTNAGSYTNQDIFHFIEKLREQARVAVKNRVHTQLISTMQQLESVPHYRDKPTAQRSFISSLITQLMIGSFAQFDTTWINASNGLMLEFFRIQELINSLWTTIETTRKELYKNYFCLIYQALEELQLPPETFTTIITREPYGALQLAITSCE